MSKEMKGNQHVQPVINMEAGNVTFNVKGHDPIVLEMSKLHPSIVARAALHGMAQVRIVDAAAVGMEDDDGNIIPEDERIAMKHERMARLVDHYHTGTGQWALNVGAGGGAKSITLEAIARVQGVPYEQAKLDVTAFAEKKYAGDTKKALAYFRSSKQVAGAILAIRAERMPTAKVDADEALKELGQ